MAKHFPDTKVRLYNGSLQRFFNHGYSHRAWQRHSTSPTPRCALLQHGALQPCFERKYTYHHTWQRHNTSRTPTPFAARLIAAVIRHAQQRHSTPSSVIALPGQGSPAAAWRIATSFSGTQICPPPYMAASQQCCRRVPLHAAHFCCFVLVSLRGISDVARTNLFSPWRPRRGHQTGIMQQRSCNSN